jgi:hypothetical protein
MYWKLALTLTVGLILAGTLALADRDSKPEEATILPADHPAVQYNQAPVDDPVSRLDQQLGSGKARLEYRQDGTGYLKSILDRLGINADSQILVFSKTSFQATKISPRAPRALFFSDDVMVGSVKGGDVFEFAALDPRQGFVFYTLDLHPDNQPRFIRRDVCLQCHQGPATQGVPGIMIASVFPDATGMPAFRSGMPVTDQRTAFQDRWGGWYVSGTHGGMRHRGNAVARDPKAPDVLESQGTQNVTDLSRKFEPAGYLSQVSDIVALMTLEHQTRMTNLMTRLGWEQRIAEHDSKAAPTDAEIDSLVTYMLFADEAPLYDPVAGVSTFTKTFPQRGPRDHQGRSLRDFDLEKRLFKYPLSYMIYTKTFDSMPQPVRDRIYQRLFDVLSGKDQSPRFAKLSESDRTNVLAILRDTKPDLPVYFRPAAGAGGQ